MASSSPTNVQCPAYFDLFIHWMPGVPGQWSEHPCPNISMTASIARRYCHPTGLWTDRDGQPVEDVSQSYTDYYDCSTSSVRNWKIFTEEDQQIMDQAGFILTCIGLGISLVSVIFLVAALLTYSIYPMLLNYRTRIHRQLFIALLIEACAYSANLTILIRDVWQKPAPRSMATINSSLLIINNDSTVKFNQSRNSNYRLADVVIYNLLVVLWELSQTCAFVWSCVEAIHIHGLIVVTIFPSKFRTNRTTVIAWITSFMLTSVWAFFWMQKARFERKWIDYVSDLTYWIMDAPRLAILVINTLLLLNVMRVLLRRMQTQGHNETVQIKKAAKAAALLIPLFGFSNAGLLYHDLNNKIGFIFLLCLQVILPALRGLAVTLIYCFLNRHVKRQLSLTLHRMQVNSQANDNLSMQSRSTAAGSLHTMFSWRRHKVNTIGN